MPYASNSLKPSCDWFCIVVKPLSTFCRWYLVALKSLAASTRFQSERLWNAGRSMAHRNPLAWRMMGEMSSGLRTWEKP